MKNGQTKRGKTMNGTENFTQGDWKVLESGAIVDVNGFTITQMPGPMTDKVLRANADLVVTAPEMLNELKEAIEDIQAMNGDMPEDPKKVNEYHRMAKRFKIMIAKALGENNATTQIAERQKRLRRMEGDTLASSFK